MEVGKAQCNLPVSTQPNNLHQQLAAVPKENEANTTKIQSMEINLNDSKIDVYNAEDTLPECKKLDGEIVYSEQSSVEPAVNESSTPVMLDNILSPPKSEIQTDDTNTATSSSPASDAHMSLIDEQLESTEITRNRNVNMASVEPRSTPPASPPPSNYEASALIDNTAAKTINSTVFNGALPKSGKPLSVALNKKQVVRKQKATVYKSEISDKIGIKLCIKKPQTEGKIATGVSKKKRVRKASSSLASEPDIKRKKEKLPQGSTTALKKTVSFASGVKEEDNSSHNLPIQQSVWGTHIPDIVLKQIFKYVVAEEGCLPTLYRLGRVCSQWRQVALSPSLWHHLDLSGWIKEKYRTELKLKWFLDNRCSACTELIVSNWKITDVNCFLQKLAKGCPNLKGIALCGWKRLTNEHLAFLVDNMKHLERIDLTSVNAEMNASKSAVGLQSLCYALEQLNERLTHLHLAQNRLAGLPQIVNMLATYCSNLQLLDLSQVSTQATSHGVFPIEKLQHGCQKLKVLRLAKSHISYSIASVQERMESPGFPELEELCIAAPDNEGRILCDEHLERILKTSTKLKILDIRGCACLTHTSLVRLPSWDMRHLFLSFSNITKGVGSGLELVASKWAHTLIEIDLAWANVQQPLDNALRIIAEKGKDAPLAHLNLCGSSVSAEAVKDILANCRNLSSINLASCRGLPRGVKRLVEGAQQLKELREVLQVEMKFELPVKEKLVKDEHLTCSADDAV